MIVYGSGTLVMWPICGLRECFLFGSPGENVKRCRRVVKTKSNSIFASGSPRQVLGPVNTKYTQILRSEH